MRKNVLLLLVIYSLLVTIHVEARDRAVAEKAPYAKVEICGKLRDSQAVVLQIAEQLDKVCLQINSINCGENIASFFGDAIKEEVIDNINSLFCVTNTRISNCYANGYCAASSTPSVTPSPSILRNQKHATINQEKHNFAHRAAEEFYFDGYVNHFLEEHIDENGQFSDKKDEPIANNQNGTTPLINFKVEDFFDPWYFYFFTDFFLPPTFDFFTGVGTDFFTGTFDFYTGFYTYYNNYYNYYYNYYFDPYYGGYFDYYYYYDYYYPYYYYYNDYFFAGFFNFFAFFDNVNFFDDNFDNDIFPFFNDFFAFDNYYTDIGYYQAYYNNLFFFTNYDNPNFRVDVYDYIQNYNFYYIPGNTKSLQFPHVNNTNSLQFCPTIVKNVTFPEDLSIMLDLYQQMAIMNGKGICKLKTTFSDTPLCDTLKDPQRTKDDCISYIYFMYYATFSCDSAIVPYCSSTNVVYEYEHSPTSKESSAASGRLSSSIIPLFSSLVVSVLLVYYF